MKLEIRLAMRPESAVAMGVPPPVITRGRI